MMTFRKHAASALAVALGLASGSALADTCTTYTISAAPAEAAENNWLTFNVYRTGDSNAKVTATYQTVPLTATATSDYTSVSGTLTFNPNETLKTVSVWVKPDPAFERPETLQLVLNGTGTQPPLTNGVGVLLNSLAVPPGTVPPVPSVPAVGVPNVTKPPNPCGPGPSCN